MQALGAGREREFYTDCKSCKADTSIFGVIAYREGIGSLGESGGVSKKPLLIV